jgi:hypothetical protein
MSDGRRVHELTRATAKAVDVLHPKDLGRNVQVRMFGTDEAGVGPLRWF